MSRKWRIQMHLNQTAEYALRAMSFLALYPERLPIRAKDLALEVDIPQHYLSKIMRKLVMAELVTSQKGHGGGFCLAKPPGQIRFLDILEAVDYQIKPDSCVFGWGQCNNENPCPIHHLWSDLNDKFLDWCIKSNLYKVKKKRKEADIRRSEYQQELKSKSKKIKKSKCERSEE
ncbi:MAG: Rrf2 family transcriptional regulator [Planctomycetota bacterium]|nr:MAG: Rrf2 family transcriptional regulator [Planctomycetota bacterium]